ncbi:MAG: cytochrome b N-terminal domain-containing protein [Chloroflexota bacterium]|nr:cytochrome b N-terminal domain-containing protein [Chloroflexota bacterium]
MARAARNVAGRVPRFPRPGDIVQRLPGPIRKRVDRSAELGKRTWEDVKGSIVRNGWPTSVRGRSLAVMNSVFLHLHPIRTRPDAIKMTYTFGLGGISFFLFLLLTLTGVLLMFYYIPTVDRAWQTLHDIQETQPFGFLLRNLHRYAAHAMVFVVFLHMCRVFYTGSFRAPRQFNWVVGVILLVLTFLLSYTGYLLPWDQLSLWAVTVGVNMVGSTPVLGDLVKFFLIGDYSVGQNALIRFYTLHVVALPLVTGLFLAVHFWRIRKDGFSRGLTFTSRVAEPADTRSPGARAAGQAK